ncbi:MAG TPA: HAD family phosphatase [Perlabentimonas sp.]|nr:HAD family phosphatase [Bacteroidales bacterium]MDD4672077.1 HAD family phosphatase [Bacteroidales bacterium]MDY0349478.1 HAD family phosphatase [Tenuifilaceae bacterium]HZJ73300.1 HAD family phosphatase [Perlabentimonas sp.]
MSKPVFLPHPDKNIKNIIFDLGGVVLDIDYSLTIDAFRNLGVSNIDLLFGQAQQVELFDQMDKGLLSAEEFRNGIREISNLPLPDAAIDKAWSAMLLPFNTQRLELLKTIGKHYRTFLLSNTNAMHMGEYNKMLLNTYGLENLSIFFEKTYYSHIINMRKPDAEAFEIILHENSIKPSETLFIDDSIQHIDGAKKLGIFAYHLDVANGEHIDKLFTTSQ